MDFAKYEANHMPGPDIWSQHSVYPHFIDRSGRVIWPRGLNVSSSVKTPVGLPSQSPEALNPEIPITFVGKPFPVSEARQHFARLQSYGHTLLRFLVTWEAIEHFGPGVYDYDYLDYVVDILAIAKEYRFKVYIDPHQDVWSRACGGDGHPLWTLELVGLDPTRFRYSNAAIVESEFYHGNEQGEPHHPGRAKEADVKWVDNFPTMVWATNYFKLAASTMFTLFFGGKTFCPEYFVKWQMPGSEEPPMAIHIQEFLMISYVNAFKALALHIESSGLHDSVVVGYETMNELNGGYIGLKDITKFGHGQNLKMRFTPTPLQTFLLGIGETCKVAYYTMTPIGPIQTSTKRLKGTNVWKESNSVSDMIKSGLEKRHERNPNTERAVFTPFLNELKAASTTDIFLADDFVTKRFHPSTRGCIWAASGVYDPSTKEALHKDYFSFDSSHASFLQDNVFQFFVEYFRAYATAVRQIVPQTMIFIGPETHPDAAPTQLVRYPEKHPPRAFDHPRKHSEQSLASKLSTASSIEYVYPEFTGNEVHAPHFYDALSLTLKTVPFMSVEVFSLLSKTKSFFSCVHFFVSGLQKAIANEIGTFAGRGAKALGPSAPVIIGETGIQFDLNGKDAYRSGNYTDQFILMDALHRGFEKAFMGYTLWVYNPENSNKWGDNWNGEDLSVFSPPAKGHVYMAPSLQLNEEFVGEDVRDQIFPPTIDELALGTRVLPSFSRPYPIKTPGLPLSFEFEPRTGTMTYTFQPMTPSHSSHTLAPQSWQGWLELLQNHEHEEFMVEFFMPRCWFRGVGDLAVHTEHARTSWSWDLWRQRLYWFIPLKYFHEGNALTITVQTPLRYYPTNAMQRVWHGVRDIIWPSHNLIPIKFDLVNEIASFPDLHAPACGKYLRTVLKLQQHVLNDMFAFVDRRKDAGGASPVVPMAGNTVAPMQTVGMVVKDGWGLLIMRDVGIRVRIEGKELVVEELKRKETV